MGWATPLDEGEALRQATRRDLFKFAFVRNPFSRLLSAYQDKHVVGEQAEPEIWNQVSGGQRGLLGVRGGQYHEGTTHKGQMLSKGQWGPDCSFSCRWYCSTTAGVLHDSSTYYSIITYITILSTTVL